MDFLIENKKHKIVYIEYHDNIPHSAITNDEHGFSYWDFFIEQDYDKDIRAYNSGGGPKSKITAPTWIDGFIGRYWIADGFEMEGTPKNAKRLKFPKLIYGCCCNSRNPFVVAEIVYSYYWCERCGYHSTEICDTHMYDDDEGNLRYRDDDSFAE